MAKSKSAQTEAFDKGKSLLSGLGDQGGGTAVAESPEPEVVETETTAVPEAAPEETTSEPSESPAPESTTSPSSDSSAASKYLNKIKELGFENVESEEEALNRLIESYQKQNQQFQQVQQAYQQVQPYVQYGQQYLQQLQNPAYQQFQAQSQAPKQTEPEQDPTKWWNPPQFDPVVVDKYREIVVDTATGEKRLEWKANTPAEVRAAVESHQAYREKWAEELVSNPQKALAPFKQEVLHEVKKQLDEMFGTTEQQREINTFAQRIKEENAEWMFEKDPRTGTTAVDPISGQPIWSQQGQLAARYIEQAESIGIRDPYQQWNYAVLNLQSLAAQHAYAQQQQPSPAAPAPTAAEVAEAKKQELLQRARPGATSIPSRAGSVPPADADPRRTRSQNKNLSAGQKILAEMKKQGVGVG